MKSTIFRNAIGVGIFCLFTTVLSSSFASATVAPLSFTDDTTNNTNSIIHTGIPNAGDTFRYLISSDVNAVPVPTVGDDLSSWTAVADGESIIVANGQHVGVAEVDGSNLSVDFRDAQAVTLTEQAAPTVNANDATNVIEGIDTTMEYSVDGAPYVMYDGSPLTFPGIQSVNVRYAAVPNVSNVSPDTSVSFSYAGPAPVAPTVTADDDNNVITGIDTTMEYNLDNTGYVIYDPVTPPVLTGNHFVEVRVAADPIADIPVGAITSLFFTTNLTTPAVPGVSADDTNNVITGIDATMEYSLDGKAYNMYDAAHPPLLAGNHTVEVRVAAVAGVSYASAVKSLAFTYANAVPSAPSVTANDTTNVITGLLVGMEFNVDSMGYLTYSGSNAPDLSGNHFVTVRIAEDLVTDTPAGVVKNLFYTTNLTDPAAPVVVANDSANTITGLTTAMEFSVDGAAYVTFTGSNAPALAGNHTVDVRYAAVSGVSNVSPATAITFSFANPAPAAPAVTADDYNNVIVGLALGMEFNIDSTGYVAFSGSNAPILVGNKFVAVRVAENLATDTPAGSVTNRFFMADPAPVITGVTNGSFYNHSVTVSYSGSNVVSADMNITPFVSGSVVSADGTYTLVVTDMAGKVTTVTFTIDTINPIMTGVTNGSYYNSDVTVGFSDLNLATATLNGNSVTSGSVISTDGVYNLVVADLAGNSTNITFTVDKTNPIITNPTNGSYYNSNVILSFNDTNFVSAILDGFAAISGDVVSGEGIHTLTVTDLAGNSSSVTFTIDKTSPVIANPLNGSYHNLDVTLAFSDVNLLSAVLNTTSVNSGDVISAEGSYSLVVTDRAGNSSVITFTIDKTNPTVTAPTNNSYHNTDVTLAFNDTNLAGATIGGFAVNNGDVISAEGTYTLIVTDLAGNSTTTTFTIDKTNPTISVPVNGTYYGANVTLAFNDANLSGAILDGSIVVVNGAVIASEGVHTLTVTDLAGNSTTVTFTIDKTAPNVSGVINNSYMNGPATITFSDTNLVGAILNGTAFTSGSAVSADGSYVLAVIDAAGNTTTINFVIDTVNPVVTGVVNGAYYNSNVTVSFSDAHLSGAILDGSVITTGTLVSTQGVHNLVVTDLSGNNTNITFTIDKTAPLVTGVVDGDFLIIPPTITFSDTNLVGATLNGVAFTSGTTVPSGVYILIVTDLAGNSTTVNFTVDTTAVVITGVTNNAYYNSDVTITITGPNVSSVTLDGFTYVSGTPISAEGVHVLLVTPIFGSVQNITFTIDKINPLITNPLNNNFYNSNVTLAFSDVNLLSATLNMVAVNNGDVISAEGTYTLVVIDRAGNPSSVTFTIDKTNPTVIVPVNNSYHNTDVTLAFNDANLAGATLNTVPVVNGAVISAEGIYTLVVTDLAGNSTTVIFTIDKTNPTVTVPVNGTYYNANVTLAFSDPNLSGATLNLNPVVSGAVVSADGVYVLVVTDLAGNSKTVTFTIDKTAPTVTVPINGVYYGTNVTLNFSDTNLSSATLDSAVIANGAVVSTEGVHVLIVTDLAGNSTTVTFTIDKTAPAVTGVVDGSSINTSPVITITDVNLASVTLNGVAFVSGTTVIGDGVYHLYAIDLAGNFVNILFTIDTVKPVVTGLVDGEYINHDVILAYSDTNLLGATLDGVAALGGDTVSTEGIHTLVVTDKAGNVSTITFTVDKTAPVVTGVIDGKSYPNFVTISFTDVNLSTATLNGNAFTSGTKVSTVGKYALIVTDKAGNKTTVNFTIYTPVVAAEIQTNNTTNSGSDTSSISTKKPNQNNNFDENIDNGEVVNGWFIAIPIISAFLLLLGGGYWLFAKKK